MSGELLDKPKQFPTSKEMTEWAYAALATRELGQTITYAELSEVLTVDAQLKRAGDSVRRAGRRLLHERSKLLVNVRNVGFRIAKPNEHARESRRDQRNSARRMRRALIKATHCLLDALTPEERNAVLTEQVRVGLKVSLTSRLDRQKELPPKQQLALPNGRALVQLLTKKA